LIHFNIAFIPNNQASIITDPCKGSFHFPSLSVAPQLSAVLSFWFFAIASMWSNQIYFQALKSLSKWIAVISFISNKSCRSLFRPASSWAGNIYRLKCFFRKFYFCGRCRGKGASQRNTLAVDHHHPLRSFTLFGFPDAGAPFFAGAKLPSIKASFQSSNPFSSSFDKNLRHTSSQTPWSSHSRNRRQHVDGLGYRSGRSCQRAPVRRIQRMPSKTSRLSEGGRPPFGFFFGSGSSGFNSFHWSSFMNCWYLAIGLPPIA
jgi:hypothetical protein